MAPEAAAHEAEGADVMSGFVHAVVGSAGRAVPPADKHDRREEDVFNETKTQLYHQCRDF